MITRHAALLAACLFFGFSAALPAGEPEGKPKLVSVEKIWDKGKHNAFPDIARFKGKFFVTFREGNGHVGGDGRIRVLVSDDAAKWQSAALIAEKDVDLRDPKLSITPDGRLMIVAGGSVYKGGRKLLGMQPRVVFSKDGKEWTKPRRVLAEGDWLWRVTWNDGVAYGVAYRRAPRENSKWHTTLYKSQDGVKWEQVVDFEIPNRPNETTLRFLPDGEMVALVRREAGSRNGWIGVAKPPYTKWSWTETKHRLGGPNFIRLPNGELWAGSRSYPGGAKTVLAKMTKTDYEPVLTLPSGGDTSYPGFVWRDDVLWMCYYSSHEGKTSIYLAKIRFVTGN